ncbi:sigma-54 interaction domain-containing protein [Aneurinibacillus sp. REN35]|uniref:sigma-54 interaction domain-containing protein n=1 Tax=Aneurinibacillus sp. REN35 TaxID=3237286 RepID=UPI003526D8A0
MSKLNSILLVAYHHSVLRRTVEQLHQIGFQDLFHIEARTVDEINHALISEFSLVVVTSEIICNKIKPFFSSKTAYIIARRMINFSNVRKLLGIQKGTEVYLVNNVKESADETVNMLNEIGLELHFVPYYPGKPIRKDIAIAVTPGEAEFVPEHIETVIDIGDRLIDLSTLYEIFHFFNISPDFSNHYIPIRYIQSLFQMVKELSDEMYRSKLLQMQLESIVHNIDDAVIVYTEQETFEIINHKAKKLLELESIDVQKKPLKGLISKAFYETIACLAMDQDQFKDIDGTMYYMRKKSISINNETFAFVVVFRKVDEFQQIEIDYRINMKNRNFLARYTFKDIKTRSASLLQLLTISNKLARSDSTILILGETGTGKEVLAQAIHNASPRQYHPFVAINFAAISESLLDSELFGYESGAFTGAKKGGHIGVFEQAHKGSIFLDEIGDASPSIQNHLLRVLQEKQIMKVGGDKVISLDVRVIAATNQDLEQLIEEERFRQDLYYRLNVLPLHLPPLRERREDLPLLLDLFLKEFQSKLGAPHMEFSKAALQTLLDYDWPGNIRELRNVVEYLAHVCEGTIYVENLPFLSKKLKWKAYKGNMENDSLFKIMMEFQKKGFLNEMITILAYLGTGHIDSAGRPSILSHLHWKGRHLTDQQLRYRLKLLVEHELINSERGRKGSQITSKGRDFLQYCMKQPNNDTK